MFALSVTYRYWFYADQVRSVGAKNILEGPNVSGFCVQSTNIPNPLKSWLVRQMLARMKQDAAVAPSQLGNSPFEQVPPLGGPASARRPDSAADDATPRSGGMHARKASQLVRPQPRLLYMRKVPQ